MAFFFLLMIFVYLKSKYMSTNYLRLMLNLTDFISAVCFAKQDQGFYDCKNM